MKSRLQKNVTKSVVTEMQEVLTKKSLCNSFGMSTRGMHRKNYHNRTINKQRVGKFRLSAIVEKMLRIPTRHHKKIPKNFIVRREEENSL